MFGECVPITEEKKKEMMKNTGWGKIGSVLYSLYLDIRLHQTLRGEFSTLQYRIITIIIIIITETPPTAGRRGGTLLCTDLRHGGTVEICCQFLQLFIL